MEKYVIITGASNGIGFSLAEKLSEYGFTVFNLDYAEPPLETKVEWIYCDVRDMSSLESARSRIIHQTTGTSELIALVNNAGVNHLEWFEKITPGNYDKVMDTNVKGTFFTTHVFLGLLAGWHSTVINIISNAADKPMTCSSIYNASKGAVKILTKQLARELTPLYEIPVIGISPNKILDTKMSEYVDDIVPVLRGWSPEEAHKYELANIPCRKNTPLEIFTDFVAHIIRLEKDNKYMSGNIIEYGV